VARPQKNNATYFTHDSDMRNDLKVKALRKNFGLKGYAIWNMFLEVMCSSHNFVLKKNQLKLMAMDFDVDLKELEEIIAFCIDKDLCLLVEKDEGYTSPSMLDRMQSLVNKRNQTRKAALKRWDSETQASCLKLATMLSDLIKKNNSKCTMKESQVQNWMNDIRLIHEQDKQSYRDIELLLRYSQNHSFWKTVILSGGSLRRNWNRLSIQILTDKNQGFNFSEECSEFKGVSQNVKME